MVYNDEILKEETMGYPERSMHWFVFQALIFVQMCSVFHCLVTPIILAFLCEKVHTFLVYLSSPHVNEFSNCMTVPCVCVCVCVCVCAQLLGCVRLFGVPWTIDRQAPLSMNFSRQEYWNGYTIPPPGDLRNPGIELGSPVLQADSFPAELPGKPSSPIN